jgi:RNA polymerase sigma-70 factor (ECF subfamily)
VKEAISMTDEGIVNLYWDRNEAAIKETDLKYGRYCFSISYNILSNKEDSDECVNDTGLKTWDSIPPNNPDSLRAYVGRITRNLALSRVEGTMAQKRGGGQLALCLDELSECVSGKDNISDIADKMALKECLNKFLAALKEDERVFFVQRYWYMMSVSDIARQSGCTESKVKMSLARSRDSLSVLLKKEGYNG